MRSFPHKHSLIYLNRTVLIVSTGPVSQKMRKRSSWFIATTVMIMMMNIATTSTRIPTSLHHVGMINAHRPLLMTFQKPSSLPTTRSRRLAFPFRRPSSTSPTSNEGSSPQQSTLPPEPLPTWITKLTGGAKPGDWKRALDLEFLAIAAPAFVQFTAEPLAGLVDTAYLGRLGATGKMSVVWHE